MKKIYEKSKNNNILTKYKIIKELGYGMEGTVYMIEYIDNTKNTSKYALKIEHILKKDLKPNTKSNVWRELNFYVKIGYLYPEQFVNLIEYDFIDGCEHEQKYSFDLKLFPKQIQNKFRSKESSKYCIRKVFELVDGNLSDLVGQLEPNQIYSLIVQIAYSIKLLHKYNYIHGDLHLGNIGWIRTNKNYIYLDKLKVKTFGYQFKLIDFGLVLSKSDIRTKREQKTYDELFKVELGNLKYFLVDNKFWNWFKKNNLNYNPTNLFNDIKKTDEFGVIKKFTTDKNDQVFLYDILFQQQYQKIVCGTHYKKTIQRKLFIPKEDILVMIKIYQDPDLMIKYFYDKIN